MTEATKAAVDAYKRLKRLEEETENQRRIARELLGALTLDETCEYLEETDGTDRTGDG